MRENIRSYFIQIYHWLLLFPKLSIFLKGEKYYKGGDIIGLFDQSKLSPEMKFILETRRLNDIARAGWLQPGRDVPFYACESVAEHILGMLRILRILRVKYEMDFPGVQWEEAIIMTIGHEYGEIRNKKGDITPKEGISPEEKYQLEHASILQVLGTSRNGNYDLKLWYRYTKQEDPTAYLVKQVDYLQMIIEAKVLEKRYGLDLSEFYEESKLNKRLTNPVLPILFHELV